jgi:hypothetical protein
LVLALRFARHLARAGYDWFIEGFGAAYLKEATALLDELA